MIYRLESTVRRPPKPKQSRIPDWIASSLVWAGSCLVLGLFIWLVSDLVIHGFGELSLAYILEEPRSSGRAGGISTILVSSALILAVSLSVSIPLGLGTAIFLSEYTERQSLTGKSVRLSLDVLAGVPSIVFGLFGNALFCKALGMGFSILSGGLTLACMVLPYFIRIAEDSLRSVSLPLRIGAAALGLSSTSTVFKLILPAALPGIAGALILSIGRSLSETAALVFTSGYVDRMPESLLDSGRSLSIHIYDLAMNVPGGDRRAYSAGLVLLTLLAVINYLAASLGRLWSDRSAE